MLQLADTKLHKLRRQLSQQFVFPEELAENPDDGKARQLLDIVTNYLENDPQIKDGSKMSAMLKACSASLASQLSRRQLNHIFSALLILADEDSRLEGLSAECLYHVLKLRVTPSLAELAWSFFQRQHTRTCMAKALSVAISALQAKDKNQTAMPAFGHKISQITKPLEIDSQLFKKLAADYLANEAQTPLVDYLAAMQMLPDTPFTLEFMTACFCQDDDLLISRDSDLFIYTLKKSNSKTQVNLLNHYLSNDILRNEWQAVNLSLRKVYGAPERQQINAGVRSPARLQSSSDSTPPQLQSNSDNSPAQLQGSSDVQTQDGLHRGNIWPLINPDAAERFRVWEMLYRLDKHISFSHRKRLFYKKIQPYIREISHWNTQTLVLFCGSFYLADYSEDNDCIIYYDRNTYELLSEMDGERQPLHRQHEKTPTAREVILTGHQHHIVRVELNSINLLYAIDFFIDQQNIKKF